MPPQPTVMDELDIPQSQRPSVSVVVPFAGDQAAARALFAALGQMRLAPGDEIVVVDNSDGLAASGQSGSGFARVVAAPDARSSYYARNVGAETAANEWLLFLDADCVPEADLLDRYFATPVAPNWGAVAGEILGEPDQPGVIPRYARSRSHLRQELTLAHPFAPMAVTANLLVRREAWEALGGFHEGIRSAGDSDFSWRLQQAGWGIGYAPGAVVHHRHRATLPALARQFARYGAGGAWAARRHPGYRPKSVPRELLRAVAGVGWWTARGQLERALFKAIDGVVVVAGAVGWLMGNVSSPRRARASASAPRTGLSMVALVDRFPELSETFILNEIRALSAAGHHVRVEAGARAPHPSWRHARGLALTFLEDDGIARKALDLAWLLGRHPLRCARDMLDRRRWRRDERPWPLRSLAPVARRAAAGGERHLHAYFAAGCALNALRLGRLLDLPYSVTAYAYDVYRSPTNLIEKLESAALVVTASEVTARDLRAMVGPGHAAHVQVVGMGIDPGRFHRRRPHTDGCRVLAVGRLVEKKGFEYLVDAAALLAHRDKAVEISIVGGGPGRDALERRARARGVEARVMLLGSRRHDTVPELMEAADVFAMPCVIAGDGDRDSAPNVVCEALAMELPVVATDVAGLPEVVRPEWGRVVPSRDAGALAAAIEEILGLPLESRIAMGRRGREWVRRHRDPAAEATKLAALLRQH